MRVIALEKAFSFLGKKFDVAASFLAENQIVRAIRRGMLYIMPLILVGSFTLTVINLPIKAFQDFMRLLFTDEWRTVALFIYNGTLQTMSITALIAVTYCYAHEKKPVRFGMLGHVSVQLVVFACYIILNMDGESVISLQSAGATGLFSALVIAVVATNVFFLFYNMPFLRIKFETSDANAIFVSSLATLWPALLTLLTFALVKGCFVFFELGTYFGLARDFLMNLIFSKGSSLLSAEIFSLLSHILWLFGVHGTNVLEGVSKDLFLAATEINVSLVAQGLRPTEIITKEFMDNFVYLGGCGATLGLLVALLVASKSASQNKITRLSLFPGIFNINEMMVYGLPLIYNPYFIVPFLATPLVLAATSYAAMYFGLVPLTSARVIWTAPIFISGYVSTGSFAGVALQAVNFFLSIAIYFPFVKLHEKHRVQNSKKIFDQLADEIRYVKTKKNETFIRRNNEVGVLARSLAEEIEACIKGKDNVLHIEYQPKVNLFRRVEGAEALIRWRHPVYGYVSPIMIVSIAEEAGLSNALGQWIIRKAMTDLKRFHSEGLDYLHLSINLSPNQLKTDDALVDSIEASLAATEAPPTDVEFELTENETIDQSPITRAKLRAIKELGMRISIDDFGMGHSSLLYIRDFYATIVKIDISLVKMIEHDAQSRQIIQSILSMCADLNLRVIAEGVETEEQMKILLSLGCYSYQGFLFSKALPYDQFVEFAKTSNATQNKGESAYSL